MAEKSRDLLLKTFLEEQSDKRKAVTTAEIREYLAENGCPVTVQTLRKDIRMLQATGCPIMAVEGEGLATRYQWVRREWSTAELQILVDAVSSAQFLSREKSNELIRKLSGMAGPSEREELTPQLLIGEKIKAPNEQILTVVDAIRKAMRNNRQITFQYYMYDARRERAEWRVAKHAGKEYRVSPYATIWNNERYYLIGYSERHGGLATFRIDRMGLPEMTAWNRKPAPADFRIQDYTEKVFSMYQGPEKKVTLQCVNGILDQVIDKFGEEIMIRRIRENVFEVTVSVNVSTTFFSWVFAFPGEMTITGPETVIKQYTDYLEIVLDDVLSEGLKVNG